MTPFLRWWRKTATLLLLLLLPSLTDGKDEWLAIEFRVIGEVTQHEDGAYACIDLALRPEEGTEFERRAEVEHRPELPDSEETLRAAEAACAAAGGAYAGVAALRDFVGLATGDSGDAEETCGGGGEGTCAAAATDPSYGASASGSKSPLAQAVQTWNDRFFNMDTATTRENSVRFHGRGSEPKFFAQQVSHFVMPKDVQQRITERLAGHNASVFGDEGAGQGGTTGAHFLSGNVGFGNSGQGANLMDLIFPKSNGDVEATAPAAASPRHEGDLYARHRAKLFGEAETGTTAPDLVRFQDEVLRTVLARPDTKFTLGSDVAVQWQHRLWRYGPNFNPKAKGGIWHKDTCPFGINGALPEGSMMFTIVYILYTENLDGPTAGTRARDDQGSNVPGTVISLPCIAGEANIIRSGESDPNAFFHSGPLNIQKMDPSRPAYRVMLQSKVVLRHRRWNSLHRVIPHRGHWRGLKMEPLTPLPASQGSTTQEEALALKKWMRRASEIVTGGVAESNAVGFEAYPINVHRAWEVTRDLGRFLGFKTGGFLPESDSAATPVVLFGFDARHTEGLIDLLSDHSFRPLVIASDADFAGLRAAKQDRYANMDTGDIDAPAQVSALLANNPYDLHIVVDVPPAASATRGHARSLLDLHNETLAAVAAKGKGEGRIATVALLSQQMPSEGKSSAGRAAGGETPVQRAYLEEERRWVEFGRRRDVRVVVMRVADRLVTPRDSAMRRVDGRQERSNPCRVEACGDDHAITRVHSEDLHSALLRMLSMFDIVDVHGADAAMRGTAAFAASGLRFPSGTVLEVVDDGPSDSMREAELWASLMMGTRPLCGACGAGGEKRTAAAAGHRAARGRNAELKAALGMPGLRYPSYRVGGAKLFGSSEL